MKNLYVQCNMGAAGDMLMAALLELLDEPWEFIDEMNQAGIPKVCFSVEKSVKCGIGGSYVKVEVAGKSEQSHDIGSKHTHTCESAAGSDEKNHSHHHMSLHEIYNIIDSLNVSSRVKEDAVNIYKVIADAESTVHGRKVSEIHFHEVGTYDAIADIVGVCALIEKLSPDKIISSSICVGNGSVKCAHGILPVPAPATALILKDVPIFSGEIYGELCTPTGAALLKYFVNEYGSMPLMNVEKIGYGMGTKDFEMANCVRVMFGESFENTSTAMDISNKMQNNTDEVVELCCNLDDMTGEAVAFAMECLFDEGALDVYTISAGMKKNRPGIILCCLCDISEKEKFIKLIFRHTSTIGVRQYICDRAVLNRKNEEIETELGKISVKKSSGYGVERQKPEFEDIRKIARENNMSINEVIEKIK